MMMPSIFGENLFDDDWMNFPFEQDFWGKKNPLYGKHAKNMMKTDIREHGSGNAGTTNALRTFGKKAGAMTLLGDCLKCVLAIVVVRLIFRNSAADVMPLLAIYAAAGCVLGHNFPCYLHFKGGKGIASMAGILVSMDWRVTLVCAALFLGAVIITRYVSLGSILVVISFFIQMLIYGSRGDYRVSEGSLMEFFAISFILMAMAIWRHRANIKRLLSGTENKLWGGKK